MSKKQAYPNVVEQVIINDLTEKLSLLKQSYHIIGAIDIKLQRPSEFHSQITITFIPIKYPAHQINIETFLTNPILQ